MASYANVTDPERRLKSNRTFKRIRQSLPAEVAARYGYESTAADQIAEKLDRARLRSDWSEVSRLAQELSNLGNEGKR